MVVCAAAISLSLSREIRPCGFPVDGLWQLEVHEV
jgi:hypothetical protein